MRCGLLGLRGCVMGSGVKTYRVVPAPSLELVFDSDSYGRCVWRLMRGGVDVLVSLETYGSGLEAEAAARRYLHPDVLSVSSIVVR